MFSVPVLQQEKHWPLPQAWAVLPDGAAGGGAAPPWDGSHWAMATVAAAKKVATVKNCILAVGLVVEWLAEELRSRSAVMMKRKNPGSGRVGALYVISCHSVQYETATMTLRVNDFRSLAHFNRPGRCGFDKAQLQKANVLYVNSIYVRLCDLLIGACSIGRCKSPQLLSFNYSLGFPQNIAEQCSSCLFRWRAACRMSESNFKLYNKPATKQLVLR